MPETQLDVLYLSTYIHNEREKRQWLYSTLYSVMPVKAKYYLSFLRMASGA